MSNVVYSYSEDGKYVLGVLKSGHEFIIDSYKLPLIQNIDFYPSKKLKKKTYIIDSKGKSLHQYLFEKISGQEIDHINLDVTDNRSENIRYCTHQQNQINQSLQKNNSSGVVGVSYYQPRKKYRARIKVSQTDIHLGYFDSFEDAVKARNVGMKCMFGSYGRYNNVGDIPKWIEQKVIAKCLNYKDLAVKNSAFFDFWEVANHE